MAPQADAARLAHFLPQIGIDPNEKSAIMLLELMNLSLNCLGAARVLCTRIEQERQVAWATSVDRQIEIEEEGFVQCALRKTFSFAVRRILSNIEAAESLHDLDPSRHIVESFPNPVDALKQGWLAAHWAILGDPDTHPFVLDKPASDETCAHPIDANCADRDGDIDAESDERLWLLRTLVPAIPSLVSETDLEGRTVLHVAARLDSVALFECALRHCEAFGGAALSTANMNGALPLHNAARFTRSEAVFNAVERAYPAALTVTNTVGMLPLHWAAAKNRSLGIVRRLLQGQPEALRVPNAEACLPLHCAGQNDCLEVVQAVFEAYPEAIRVRDHEGGLPLHHACCLADNVKVVRFLHDSHPSAMMVAQERDHSTPIHLAASHNSSPAVIEYILQACPQATELRDLESWCAAHCLLNPTAQVNWAPRRLDCLRLILRASPGFGDVYHPSQCDAVARLVLRRCRDQDGERLRTLNWRARGPFVMLLVRLAREGVAVREGAAAAVAEAYSRRYRHLQVLGVSWDGGQARDWSTQVRRNIAHDQARCGLLRQLVERFVCAEARQIPSGVLRKIVGFL